MLAFAWHWNDAGSKAAGKLAERLASSLCAGIGGFAETYELGGRAFAYRSIDGRRTAKRHRPFQLDDGRLALFHGYFDNRREISRELGSDTNDLSRLYGLAVENWGDAADDRIVGEYCAIIVDTSRERVRLARAALTAPPLCYYSDGELVAAASVPRALFAAGAPRKLNDRRVADSALMNFTDRQESWYEDIYRAPVGTIIVLERGVPASSRKYYDLHSLPDIRLGSDAEYLARVSDLLDEGVAASLDGFQRPGSTLSGGLDTPQVVVRALKALPPDQRLPTFTFHPEPDFDGICDDAGLANERPFVERFAEMHPRIEPHFTANEGYEHDYRWPELFHLMGGAPSGLCNVYVFHGLFAEAKKAGCDLLMLAEWGNYTFSDKGEWGFVEYLRRGKWRQLWLAFKHQRHDNRPLPLRVFIRTLSAFLPLSAWRFARRVSNRGKKPLVKLIQPLSDKYCESSGAQSRLDKSGLDIERYQPHDRRHAQRLLFTPDDGEAAEIYQAFEQMYGIALRDPTAYRPLVEFCFGLPVEMFMRDGTMRWMAKELAKGIMPEVQRDNYRNGRWDADWHLRIGRRRTEFLEELENIQSDERLAQMIDIPRLKKALEDWPSETIVNLHDAVTRQMAVPRALLAARFINYVEGRNQR